MIVAAHQPSYLPWLGYLAKMAIADVFVVMDDLQYEAQNFQNRNRVKIESGTTWLTVPLVRGSQRDRIIDKQIANPASSKHHWQRQTWATLSTHYRRAPYFDSYAEPLGDVYTRTWSSLVELDLHMLELARTWFGITRPVVRSSTLGLVGHKTERIIDLCLKLGATTYVSGSGGSTTYLNTEQLSAAGISTQWFRFDHPVYPQRYPQLGFIPNLAFLDLLFNCGPQSAAMLAPSKDAA